jgi:hypothetical protein
MPGLVPGIPIMKALRILSGVAGSSPAITVLWGLDVRDHP